MDHWIGRLQREYAHSEASAEQVWQLADWFTKSIDPLHGQVRQARFNRSGINADLI